MIQSSIYYKKNKNRPKKDGYWLPKVEPKKEEPKVQKQYQFVRVTFPLIIEFILPKKVRFRSGAVLSKNKPYSFKKYCYLALEMRRRGIDPTESYSVGSIPSLIN